MQPDHYGTLGLPPTATQDEIKKKYRTLARRYHPDVNPSPDAAQQIMRVNEAYHILGDADRRALYDAERIIRAGSAAPRPAGQGRANRPAETPKSTPQKPEVRPHPHTPSRTPNSRPVEFNGFGTVRENRPAAKPAPKTDTPRAAADAFREMNRFIMEAQLAFINRQYREAENLCFQALQVDRRNATAHEILGDIFTKRGQTDNAVKAYTYAVQYNPRNLTVQAKLERLSAGGRRPTASVGPTMTHASAVNPWDRVMESENRETALAAISAMLSMLFLGLCYLLYSHPGHPFMDSGWLSEFTFNLMAALAFGGTLAGVLLALNGGMRPIRDELLSRGTLRGDERSPVTLGILLTGFALVWFYASLLVYIGIAVAKNRLSLSILRAYGLTLLLTTLFGFFFQSGAHDNANGASGLLQTLAFGGNILFPALLFGWAVGDALRLKRQ